MNGSLTSNRLCCADQESIARELSPLFIAISIDEESEAEKIKSNSEKLKELYQVHKDNDKQFQLQKYAKQTGALFTPTITRDFMAFMAKRIEMRNPT
eukprot:CAMPEP_0168603648 /NCGR_PEP_ID=MMETSP0420-20121227/14849_1 /TAXON_ID=498008 /ORGANISM="Pessonella sp." /LENGTH=96 /DNA_ID=CAMNT_0008642659 /DNA_START=547 /DNA_END=834 /DNA_ORIENTATION=-